MGKLNNNIELFSYRILLILFGFVGFFVILVESNLEVPVYLMLATNLILAGLVRMYSEFKHCKITYNYFRFYAIIIPIAILRGKVTFGIILAWIINILLAKYFKNFTQKHPANMVKK